MIITASILYIAAVAIFIRMSFFGEHPNPLVGATFAFLFFAWATICVWFAGRNAGKGMPRSPMNGDIYHFLGQFYTDEKLYLFLQRLRIRSNYVVDLPSTHNAQELSYTLEIAGPTFCYVDNTAGLICGPIIEYKDGTWLSFPTDGKATIVKNVPKKKKNEPTSTPSHALA